MQRALCVRDGAACNAAETKTKCRFECSSEGTPHCANIVPTGSPAANPTTSDGPMHGGINAGGCSGARGSMGGSGGAGGSGGSGGSVGRIRINNRTGSFTVPANGIVSPSLSNGNGTSPSTTGTLAIE